MAEETKYTQRHLLFIVLLIVLVIYHYVFNNGLQSITSIFTSSLHIRINGSRGMPCGKLFENAHSLRQAESVFRNADDKSLNITCQKRLPNCLIIGVEKAGTLALLKFLSAHPNIVRNESYNEVYFFDRYYEEGMDWYLDRMPYSMPGQVVIEKTPSYFTRPEVPERVYDMNSNIRILLVVRDPVERAISAYAMERSRRRGNIEPFEQFVIIKPSGHFKSSSPFITGSLYDRHMENWLKFFNRSQIFVVDGSNLVKRPFDELGKVEHFLGLKRFLTKNKFIYNETKHFYCLSEPNSRSKIECLGANKGRSHPHIAGSIISKMKTFFEPHNERFFNMIGQWFDWT